MLIVSGEVRQVTVNSRPIKTNDRKERVCLACCCPVTGAPLRISVNKEHLASLPGKYRSNMNCERRLPYATLLVEYGDDHRRPFAEICVSVSLYFCTSVLACCQVTGRYFYCRAL